MSIIASVKPYFKYSMDLSKTLPMVAYYCKLYGVTKGMDLWKQSGGTNKEVKEFLFSELSDLEKMRAALEGTSKEDQKIAMENFLMSMFAKIDKEERTCETITKSNALDFKRCSDFIMLISMFGTIDEEWK